MSDAELLKKAKLWAMQLLERMDRTEYGLRRKLSEKYPEETVAEAIAYVKGCGYLDDNSYAKSYIRYHMAEKSRRQIFQKLQERGVKRDVIESAWEEETAEEGPDERAMIRRLILKKYPASSRLDTKQMRRLQGFLARRGFLWEDVSAVLEEEEITTDSIW